MMAQQLRVLQWTQTSFLAPTSTHNQVKLQLQKICSLLLAYTYTGMPVYTQTHHVYTCKYKNNKSFKTKQKALSIVICTSAHIYQECNLSSQFNRWEITEENWIFMCQYTNCFSFVNCTICNLLHQFLDELNNVKYFKYLKSPNL